MEFDTFNEEVWEGNNTVEDVSVMRYQCLFIIEGGAGYRLV